MADTTGSLRKEKQYSNDTIQKKRIDDPMYGMDREERYKFSSEQGMEKGRERSEQLYGMDQAEVGKHIQDIIKRQKEMLGGKDPNQKALREAEGKALRSLRSGQAARGISGSQALGQREQIRRQARQDIAESHLKNQVQTASNYQRLMGNIASNSMLMELSYGQMEAAPYSAPIAPKERSSSGIVGSFIDGLV